MNDIQIEFQLQKATSFFLVKSEDYSKSTHMLGLVIPLSELDNIYNAYETFQGQPNAEIGTCVVRPSGGGYSLSFILNGRVLNIYNIPVEGGEVPSVEDEACTFCLFSIREGQQVVNLRVNSSPLLLRISYARH